MIPVSLSGGVEPGARTGTSVNGVPVVVWRGQDAALRAWPDRCPHRGMRLSFGFVRENALVCIYHGWSFGTEDADADAPAGSGNTGGAGSVSEARCLAVPAHPGMTPPAKATVQMLPVTEALGMIWVGGSCGDSSPPQEAVSVTQPLYPVRSITVQAPVAELRAAFAATLAPGTHDVATTPGGDGIITFQGPAVRVIAALQDRGDGSAAAHLVTTDSGIAPRQALCQWAALVRDHLAAVVLP